MVGLIMVAAFSRGSMIRGLICVFIGLLLGTVGFDQQDAVPRFTFGMYQLFSGIPFAAALVGLFGFAVVFSDIKMIGVKSFLTTDKVNQELPTLSDLMKRWKAVLIGVLYGTGIGAIPGVGADGATWMAYATVKNRSANPEEFGKGCPEGILAPESANNATTGGAMVPMFTLGIPGDGSTAVMLGAMYLHGLQPGVLLMTKNADIVWGMLAGLLIATIFMFLISWKTIRWFIFVLQRDRAWLFPFILVLSTIGEYSGTNDFFGVYLAIGLGVFGYFLEDRGFPVVCVVLGLILGPIIEYNFRVALTLSNGDWFTRL